MTVLLNESILVKNKNLLTAEQAYDITINQLKAERDKINESLIVLSNPQVKKSFVENWTPDTDIFTIEDYGSD